MIDEELYQFATDELNSDRRDSELWNRACALARDDHDEARFLYTNLRVEELLEQKANGEPMPEMPDSVKGAASMAFDLDAAPNAVPSAPLGLGSALEFKESDTDSESEEIVSSSNRAFTEATSVDLSEDFIQELESSNQASASSDGALLPSAEQLADQEDRNNVEAVLNTLDLPDTNADTKKPSSIAGTETTLDLNDTPVSFDLDAAAALSDNEPLPDVDDDIVSLASQASQQLQGGKPIDPQDAVTAETGAFEPMDDISIDSTAIPTPNLASGDSAGEDEMDVVPQSTSLNESELAFLDASIDQGRDEVINQQREVLHQKDALTEELERQADSFLPEDRDALSTLNESNLETDTNDTNDIHIDSIDTRSANLDAVAESVDASHEHAAKPASDYDDDAIESLANRFALPSSSSIDELTPDTDPLNGGLAAATAAVSATAAYPSDKNSQISQDFSDSITPHLEDSKPSFDQTELLSGKGIKYRVFSRGPDDNKAVKNGVSWAALFFTLPWLLVKRMPLMAITYALFWIISLAGLAITGLNWLDAPQDAQNAMAIWPLAFAVLALIGLIVLPFFLANRWHAGSLLKKGYEEIALVRAKGPRGAIDRIMQMAS